MTRRMTRSFKHAIVLAGMALVIGLVGANLVSVVSSPVAHASKKADACSAIGGTMDKGVCKTSATEPTVNTAITAVINIMSLAVGIVSVIMLIYGGFRYVTSGGDAGATKSARSTITYALVGVVVATLAQVLTQFVLSRL